MGADDLPVHGYSSTESYPKKEEFGKGLSRSGGANHQEPEPGIEMTQKAAAGEVPFRGRLRGQMAEINAFIERLNGSIKRTEGVRILGVGLVSDGGPGESWSEGYDP